MIVYFNPVQTLKVGIACVYSLCVSIKKRFLHIRFHLNKRKRIDAKVAHVQGCCELKKHPRQIYYKHEDDYHFDEVDN